MAGAYLFLALFFVFLINKVKLLNNGLALTPPMGWMSWGYYMCGDKCEENPHKCLNEKLIMDVADTFYNDGYLEAGYEYIIIDDCWSEKHRDSEGRLVPNKERFPRGMKFLADYIHSRGLKFGMYTNIAATTCMGYPGSRGYFDIDAKSFAEWRIDYLKVDGCFVEEDFLNIAYIDLGKQLNATRRPMVYSCSWPYYIEFIHHKTPNYSAIAPHCNLWRNYHDVVTAWYAIKNIIQHYEEEYENIAPYHGPGHWNDPDMLIFGTGSLSKGQSRVHLAVYVMLSAPLLLSCDMSKITPFEQELLLNLDLMAIAQDPLGIMGKPQKLDESVTIWSKPHLPRKGDIYNSMSFALVNMGDKEHKFKFMPVYYGLNSTDGYTILDIFAKDFVRNITLEDYIQATVAPNDVVMYTLYPL